MKSIDKKGITDILSYFFGYVIYTSVITFINLLIWNHISLKFNLPQLNFIEMLCIWVLISNLFSSKIGNARK
jgi:hypothetical protein